MNLPPFDESLVLSFTMAENVKSLPTNVARRSAQGNSGFDGEGLYLMISIATQMALARGVTFLPRTDNFC